MGKRERLDLLLVGRSLVGSREEGRRKIMAGDVRVNDQAVTKAGALIDDSAQISLKAAPRYVSRGGLKLEKALSEFSIELAGKTVLDVGASTGGFTDCLLAHGAAKVCAIDVGYGQFDWRLRNDPRVWLLEKTNIRFLEAESLPQVPHIATIDVSFISLKIVLPRVKMLLQPSHEIIALIKPQFEVGKGKVGKGGVVKDEKLRREAVAGIVEFAEKIGLEVTGTLESPIEGAAGNREYLALMKFPGTSK
jgi:23S rRNA (cytidine1920-2'-O)/16S rRNA (cytidine1409-2'-O)-methyltransferase